MSKFQPSHHSEPKSIPLQLIVHNPDTKPPSLVAKYGLPAAVAFVTAMTVLPTFVINPMIVKAFKPQWGYGRRVFAGMGISFLVGSAVRIVQSTKAK